MWRYFVIKLDGSQPLNLNFPHFPSSRRRVRVPYPAPSHKTAWMLRKRVFMRFFCFSLHRFGPFSAPPANLQGSTRSPGCFKRPGDTVDASGRPQLCQLS
nr:MAG TPA: hypothetical protein [Bacteriophage sp.]